MASEAGLQDVAAFIAPAVVSIEVRRRIEHPVVDPEGNPIHGFGDGVLDVPSNGSGFFFDDLGHVLTNHHVVEQARRIWVHLSDGRSLPAQVVGVDVETDVAVVRVAPAKDLPRARLGTAEDLKVGEWVAAVGNPLGYLDGTFTVGVVSGIGRSEVAIEGGAPSYQDFIQTDAAIHYGNSGGPLVNARGEVVGINTAFGGQGVGIGFAIPIDLAREVAEDLMSKGHVVRGYLGVLLQEIDADMALGLGLERRRGVLIREVMPETPAADAGLRAGDAILIFDGEAVRDVSGFRIQVAHAAVGDLIPLEALRFGETLELSIRLAERESNESAASMTTTTLPRSGGPGLRVESVGDSLGWALAGGEHGVRIREVLPDSPADDVGLRPEDIVLEADGRVLTHPRDFEAAVEGARRDRRPVVLKLLRQGVRWFAALDT